MRAYLRHPSAFPIELSSPKLGAQRESLRDVSEGGLSCHSKEPFEKGELVHIRIPVGEGFEVDGRVAWCAPGEDGYLIGIAFRDAATAFSVRMVQQVCHIEQYRKEVAEREGRMLDPEQAANEWIERYAASFPR